MSHALGRAAPQRMVHPPPGNGVLGTGLIPGGCIDGGGTTYYVPFYSTALHYSVNNNAALKITEVLSLRFD